MGVGARGEGKKVKGSGSGGGRGSVLGKASGDFDFGCFVFDSFDRIAVTLQLW